MSANPILICKPCFTYKYLIGGDIMENIEKKDVQEIEVDMDMVIAALMNESEVQSPDKVC